MKTWEKPKLIVLVRCRPEEAILQVCKEDFPGGPGSQDNHCSYDCESYCQLDIAS